MTDTKVCSKCGKPYPATTEYFRRQKAGKCGLRASCRACNKQYDAQYRQTENYQNAVDRYRSSDKYKQTVYAYHRTDEYRERERNRDRREYDRARYRKESRKLNLKASAALRYRQDREAYLARVAKRRAFKRYNGGKYTAADVRSQYQSQRGRCWHCGENVGDKYEVDHLIPLARGGANDARNIVISCRACNRSKGARLTQEWNGKLF